VRVLGYCLMTNHVHLVVVPGDRNGLAKALREAHGRYARYRNAIERGNGHVWQGRYYSCAFEAVHLASVMRYVELNPVRAGMTTTAGDYAWSSAILHLSANDDSGLVDVAQWRREWDEEQWARVLARGRDDGDAIRAATYAGRPWGSEAFVEQLESRLERRLKPRPVGRPALQRKVDAA
jgi:putative transposase